jgi:NTP pyrophosphatase (non-canonical NTP hydrolase)
VGLSLEQLQDRRWSWAIANGFNNDPDELLMGIVEELGEMCHARLKSEQGIRGGAIAAASLLDDERDAVGDLVIYLAGYCSARGFRLQACVERAWDEVKERDWKKYPINGRTE